MYQCIRISSSKLVIINIEQNGELRPKRKEEQNANQGLKIKHLTWKKERHPLVTWHVNGFTYVIMSIF